jgi:hypothetical protein
VSIRDQTDGPISVDAGFRAQLDDPNDSNSRVVERAERSAPGAWDEDLGRWGSDPWALPGEGERGPKCGEYYPEAVCDSCGEVEFGTHKCGRRSCPECWTKWAHEAAVRAAVRVQAFRYTQPNDYHRQAAHAVISPPEEAVRNEREFWEWRSRAAEIAKEKGFRGAAVIGHPWRVTQEAKDAYRAADPDRGIWVWLRREADDPHEHTYWSPHYHVIGATSADMTEAKESDPFAYKFIRSFGSFGGVRDSESHEEMYGAFRYLLSHTGFPEESTRQVMTWNGILANSVFVEDATEDWQHQKPSEGVMSALKREIEAVVGETEAEEEAESADETDDNGPCPVEGCGGVLIDVFDVRQYLRHANPPPDVTRRMEAAREWRMGSRSPPPGLKHPRTEEDARDAFERMV